MKDLFDDFTKCFSDSDKLYILDIYGAGEEPIDGISTISLIKEMKKLGSKAEFIANNEDISSIIMSNANKGDLIVMMGAGSISSWAYQLPNKLMNII